MDEKRTVIAVVPTFSPDSTLVARLEALARQVDSIIVVDDGSPDRAGPILEAVAAAGFEVVKTGHNAGIAAALNTGSALALDRGADYVLTLDQDSILADGYVASCLAAFAVAAPETRVGVVCTDRVNGEPSIPERRTPEGLGVVREAIQSGFLISKECLDDCGLFDARLFIDAVDTEFCLRLAARGWVVVVGPGTDITHALGEQALLRPFGIQRRANGKDLRYQYHRPFRRYYITRNTVDLYLRYLRTKPRWVLSSVRRELSPTVTTLVSGPHRTKQFFAFVAGVAHGLVRKRGRIPSGLERFLAS